MKPENFNTFNDIESPALRTWNRCAMLFNLNKTNGEEIAKKYAGLIDKKGKAMMFTMMHQIAEKGYENVKREINRGNALQVS